MSFARSDPANMAGSAPSKLNRGTITGFSISASTGANDITPTIARAKDPIAIIPSSNFSPNPNLFPIHLSMAPKAIKITII